MQTNLFCFSIHLFTLLLKNCRISKHSKKNFTIIQQPKKITLTRFLRTCKHNSPHNICSMDAFPGQNTIPAAPQELHGPGKAVNCSLSCLRAAFLSTKQSQRVLCLLQTIPLTCSFSPRIVMKPARSHLSLHKAAGDLQRAEALPGPKPCCAC